MAFFCRRDLQLDVEVTARAPHTMTAAQQQAWLDVVNAVDALFRAFDKPKLSPHYGDGQVDDHDFVEHPEVGGDFCAHTYSNGLTCGWPRRDHTAGRYPTFFDDDKLGVTAYSYEGVKAVSK